MGFDRFYWVLVDFDGFLWVLMVLWTGSYSGGVGRYSTETKKGIEKLGGSQEGKTYSRLGLVAECLMLEGRKVEWSLEG